MIRIPFHLLLPLLLIVASAMGKPASGEHNGIVKPTIATDAVAQVLRGGDVEISLNAIPSYGNMETFSIQSPPLHGSLSDPKNSSDHTASVIYHHDGSKIPQADTFTFRAKAPGQALSTPATVFIKIIPPPPKLLLKPDVVDFGKVLLSEKRSTNVVLVNLGGSSATGRLLLQGGFSAPSGGRYHLEEGESLSLPIEFSPMEAKIHEERVISLPAAHGASILLRGQGVPRFEVVSAPKTGDEGEASETRWRLRNLSDHPLRLSFLSAGGMKGGAVGGWILPSDTTIPPNSETNVALQQVEAEGTAHESFPLSKVRITDGLTENVVELPPPGRFIPVTVQLKPASEHLLIGGTLPLSFTLFNRCDLPKRISWEITSPLGGGTDQPVSVDLRGGETKEIQFDWKPTLPGQNVVRLFVEEGKKSHAEFFWKVGVSREPATASPPRVISEQKEPDFAVNTEPKESISAAPVVPITSDTIPQIDDVTAEVIDPWFGGPECMIRWRGNSDSHVKFIIQESLLVPKHGDASLPITRNLTQLSSMNLERRDLRPVSVKGEGDTSKALIRGLDHGSHQILITRVTDGGKVEARSQVSLYIPPQRGWWDLLKVPLGVAFIFLLLLFLRKIRGRQ